jgi:polysaccharide biosynthesis/export protein
MVAAPCNSDTKPRERGAGSGTFPGSTSDVAGRSSEGPTPHSPLPVSLIPLLLLVLSSPPVSAAAQNPEDRLQQAVQQNPGLPDVIRQRIQQSGLTPEQIRARLAASGYPTNLLDAYLGSASPGNAAAMPSALELGAIQALGLSLAPGNLLPVDTGLVVRRVSAPSAVFGVDAFRRTTTQFLPLLSGPVPTDYKLGPGDVLVLILTGDVELAYTLQVTREGFILIPQVGQVFVSNLTLEKLRDVLYTRLGRVYSGVKRGPNATTRFDVSVANVRVNQIYVVGEVAQPGAYQISSLGTVFTALYAAGGVTERANMRRIVLQRAGTPVATLDLYDYLLRGDIRSDVRLETGDVVFVPVHGTRVQVTGAVVRPAIYELAPTEALTDLLRDAGGFKSDAALRRITIHRILPVAERGPGPAPRAAVDVALTPATPGSGERGAVHDPGSGERGAVQNPGSGERGAVPSGDPPATSPVAPGKVPLPAPRSREVEVPGLAAVAIPSVPLQDGDSVVVDYVPPLNDVYFVAIAGMVNKPGAYPWRPGMKLRDLVLLARGPKVGADLKEAEIARLPQDRTAGQLATTLRVPMDSTYLFERDSAGRYVGPPGVPFPAGGAPEVPLEPFDNVLILKQAEFDFQRTVTITGQVMYPGTYSLRTKTDRLAELIRRAGGLTRQAYPDGIRFIRTEDNVGRINVNLTRALKDTSSASNVILQVGDAIEIPEYQPAVKVGGAVNSPGSVLWKKGEGLDYYLEGAGGLSYLADKGRTSVKYANGEVRTRKKTLIFSSSPTPGPGSEVFVPVRDTTARVNTVQLFTSIVQIIASTVTAIYVIKHL